MEKRKLGNSELMVSPIAFGGNVFGWTIDEQTSFNLLDQFVDAGFNLVDTADVYSRWAMGNEGGESETIIGNWLKKTGNRQKLIIATKVGGDMGTSGKKDLSKKHILRAVEDSLKRLQTDYIDLYQSHYDDPQTPVEETLEAYAQLKKEGKIRVIGASNFSSERLLAALEASEKNNYPRYESLQPLYNLYDREHFEKELQPICEQKNIGVINYYSLASGFLTGKYRSEHDLLKSARGQGNKKYLNERGFRILKALDEVAKQYNSSDASIAVAWLLHRPTITAAIASATNADQLNDLLKAADLKLDQSVMEKLNQASKQSA